MKINPNQKNNFSVKRAPKVMTEPEAIIDDIGRLFRRYVDTGTPDDTFLESAQIAIDIIGKAKRGYEDASFDFEQVPTDMNVYNRYADKYEDFLYSLQEETAKEKSPLASAAFNNSLKRHYYYSLGYSWNDYKRLVQQNGDL